MKIVIIDDHSLFSEGLAKIIESTFADVQISIFNRIEQFEKAPDNKSNISLLISDIELPGEDIFEFLTHASWFYLRHLFVVEDI